MFSTLSTSSLKTLQTRTHLARCSRIQKKEWRINKRTPELNFAQKPTLVVSPVMTKVADAGRHRKLNVKLCCSICSQCAPSSMISIFTTGCSWWTLIWTTTTRHGLLSKSECEWLSEKAGLAAKWNVYVERIDDLLFLGFSSDKIEVRDLTPSNVTFSRQGDSRYLRMLSLLQRGNSFLFSAPIGKLHNLLATPRNRFFTAYGRKRVPLIPGASFGPKSPLQQYLRHFLVYILQSVAGLG